MKLNKALKVTLVVFCAVILFLADNQPVLANSAQTWFEGVDSAGAVMTDETSPVIVEKEQLTFDINEFPSNNYQSEKDFLGYSAKVTAEYTLYNPSEYTVTSKLLFPFGNIPTYNTSRYDETSGGPIYTDDTEKFHVMINGETIEKNIRYTFFRRDRQFELDKDIALLHDGPVKDDFYTPKLPVTKYIYKADGVDLEKYKAANVAFDVQSNKNSRRIYFVDLSGAKGLKNGKMRISAWVGENGQKMTVYVIGEPFSDMPEWKFYEDGSVDDKEEIGGRMSLEGTENLTFEAFAKSGYIEKDMPPARPIKTQISSSDWYNAAVAELKEDFGYGDYGIIPPEQYNESLRNNLMRWYEYRITIKPHERIVNTVTAPVYPAINIEWEPAIYEYTYLLSPAKTWKSFEQLKIMLHTPYYLIKSGIDGFIQTEEGYELTLDGLPEGELEFTLSSSQDTQKQKIMLSGIIQNKMFQMFLGVIVLAGAVILCGGVITALILKRKKQGSASPGNHVEK